MPVCANRLYDRQDGELRACNHCPCALEVLAELGLDEPPE